MALTNCPECEKQISDTSKKCIGCGAELKKCPECGFLTTADKEICPNCGYEFREENASATKENKVENSEENREETISSQVGAQRLLKHIDDFKNENKGIRGCFWYNHRGITLIPTIAILAVIAVMLISSLIGNVGINGVIGYFLGKLDILLLVYIAVLFLISTPIGGITNVVERIHTTGRFFEYCERNKIDLLKYTTLASYIIPSKPSNNKDTKPYDFNISKDALYYGANPDIRSKYKRYNIISLIIATIISYTFGVMSLLGIIGITIADILGVSYNYLTLLKMPSAFVFYAVLAVYIVFAIICYVVEKKCFTSKRDEWFENQIKAENEKENKAESVGA